MADMPDRGFTLWLTGLPYSGKNTLANRIRKLIEEMGLRVELLEGKEIRNTLSKGLGYSKEDRDENIRRIGFVCHLLTRNNIAVIVSAISPYRAVRDENRKIIGSYIEVYVKCPVDICMKRDTKGDYRKAVKGEISSYTGISAPYEEPLSPEIIVETDRETEEESSKKVVKYLVYAGYLPKGVGDYKEAIHENVEEEIYCVEDEEKIKQRLRDLGYL